MDNDLFLTGTAAHALYAEAATLPIADYHCHLSPREIWEDRPFSGLAELWLAHDHYKWRLMRTCGIDEQFITGDAPWDEKFRRYAAAIEQAAGHPLYHWTHMELSRYFGIDEPLCTESADRIRRRADEQIRAASLSSRKLLQNERVEVLCTTDAVEDDLTWHMRLAADGSLPTRVLPTFRTDDILRADRPGYPAVLQRLSETSGVPVTDLDTLRDALLRRLDAFAAAGCRMSDVGIPLFPDRIADDAEADATLRRAAAGEAPERGALSGLIGNLTLFLGAQYRRHGMTAQWHLAVTRDASTRLYARCGADCGGDCVGAPVDGGALIRMLDTLEQADALPRTILYSLEPSGIERMASIAAAFPGVRCGAAWWFCDHKRGIRRQLEVYAENAALGTFPGMLTDSRSFLSYVRHDYFRRVLCSLAGEWVDGGEYDAAAAHTLVRRLCYDNAKEMLE